MSAHRPGCKAVRKVKLPGCAQEVLAKRSTYSRTLTRGPRELAIDDRAFLEGGVCRR